MDSCSLEAGTTNARGCRSGPDGPDGPDGENESLTR